MTINYEQVDNVIRNIIFTINALKTANNQLESEISRLSNCKGTTENPHDHSSEIASIRKTIDNNEEKIKKLDSIWKGLTSFKDNVILKDSELAESINSPEKFAAYIAGVFNNGQIAINSKSDYDMFMNAKEFVDGMEMKIDSEIVIDEKGYNDFLNEFGYGYIKMDLPAKVNGKIKRYEDYRNLSDTTSNQYKLQQYAYTDELGFRRIKLDYIEEPAYMVALGSFYTNYDSTGVVFKVKLDNGNEFYCVAGDMKSDVDTDDNNQYTFSPSDGITEQNADIIEFIMDTDNEYAKELLTEKEGGKGYGVLNFSDNYKSMSSSISEIQKLNVPCALEEK